MTNDLHTRGVRVVSVLCALVGAHDSRRARATVGAGAWGTVAVMTFLNRARAALIVAAVALSSAACTPQPVALSRPTTAVAQPTTAAVTKPTAQRGAAAALAHLSVRPAASMAGYSRAEFGPAWADVDHNSCDTRNDILARDLLHVTYRATSPHCVVASGSFVEPYTGKSVNFVRGTATSGRVQIDHTVALADAWTTGASTWSPPSRLAYANDPLVLLAVDGPANDAKGASDAAHWLPANTSYRCPYVARQVAVKAKYSLWVTPAEKAAIALVLATCPAQALPTG